MNQQPSWTPESKMGLCVLMQIIDLGTTLSYQQLDGKYNMPGVDFTYLKKVKLLKHLSNITIIANGIYNI